MATFNRFEDLPMWQEARRLCKVVKKITELPLFVKDFRFVTQINAAAGSVMDNIAEGFERGSRLEFINHLSFAKGSCGEVRSQLYRAHDFEYINIETCNTSTKEYESLAASIFNFMTYLNKTNIKGKKFESRQ